MKSLNTREKGALHTLTEIEAILILLVAMAALATFANRIGVPYPILLVLGGWPVPHRIPQALTNSSSEPPSLVSRAWKRSSGWFVVWNANGEDYCIKNARGC
jgi:hypothetical protein